MIAMNPLRSPRSLAPRSIAAVKHEYRLRQGPFVCCKLYVRERRRLLGPALKILFARSMPILESLRGHGQRRFDADPAVSIAKKNVRRAHRTSQWPWGSPLVEWYRASDSCASRSSAASPPRLDAEGRANKVIAECRRSVIARPVLSRPDVHEVVTAVSTEHGYDWPPAQANRRIVKFNDGAKGFVCKIWFGNIPRQLTNST